MDDLEPFRNALWARQPEVVPILFDYFAAALETAPTEKVREFGVWFQKGVLDALDERRTRA